MLCIEIRQSPQVHFMCMTSMSAATFEKERYLLLPREHPPKIFHWKNTPTFP